MTNDIRRNILKSVFSTSPARPADSYIKSYAFDQRYVLLSGGKLEKQPVFFSYRLPKWLRECEALGSYEKGFLNDVLNAPGRVVAYRSGTGSGKSSLVRAISESMATFAQERNWQQNFHCSSFIATIDLQAADAADVGINARLDDDGNTDDQLDLFDDRLYGLLFEKLLDCLQAICSDGAFKTILKELESTREFKRSAPFRGLVSEMAPMLQSDSDILVDKFVEYLNARTRKEAFDILLHLYLFIGHLHYVNKSMGNHKKSFVLFIDNSDKLHHVLLTRFINHLKEFASKTEHFSSDLKIALFLRLSTSKDQIGAIAEADYRYFSSPEPTDIILYKAVDFVLSENEGMGQFSASDVLSTKFAVLELLVELLDGRIQDFSNSIDAISGTNIRNAFTHVVAWCSSEELKLRQGSKTDFERIVQDFMTLFLFTEIRSIVRKFDAFVLSYIERSIDQGMPISSIRASARLEKIYEEYQLEAARQSSQINSRMKRVLMQRVVADPQLMQELAQNAFSHTQLKDDSRALFRKIKHFPPSVRNSLIEMIDGCVERVEKQLEDESLEPAYRARLILFAEYYGSAQRCFLETKLETTEQQFSELPERAGGQNRFERTLLLYDVESEEEESSLRPVNLISLDERMIRTCSLRIIYYLSEQQDSRHSAAKGVKYDTIKSKLKAYGYRTGEIRESMRTLTDLSTRLIYSRVADHHYYSGKDWERCFIGKGFFVSWAGYKYFQSMLANPTYVQWMLSNTSSISARYTYDHLREGQVTSKRNRTDGPPGIRVLESMQNVVDGFSELVEYEAQQLSRMTDLDARSVSHICRSPLIDLMHRSSPAFLRTIKYVEGTRTDRHVEGRLPEGEREQFESIKYGFVNILAQGQELCDQYFGDYPISWDGILENAEEIARKTF